MGVFVTGDNRSTASTFATSQFAFISMILGPDSGAAIVDDIVSSMDIGAGMNIDLLDSGRMAHRI